MIVAILIVWFVVGGFVGYLSGDGKGRGVEGFWWGAILGWIGWIIIALAAPDDRAA